jgi:uncharacterized membrane protein
MKSFLKLFLLLFFLTSPLLGQSKLNKLELTLAGAAIGGDAYSTYNMVHTPGGTEYNPLAKIFTVNKPGTIVYFGGSYSLLIYSNHLLRNHTVIRHSLNWSVIGFETFLTVNNTRYTKHLEHCSTQWISKGVLGNCY